MHARRYLGTCMRSRIESLGYDFFGLGRSPHLFRQGQDFSGLGHYPDWIHFLDHSLICGIVPHEIPDGE
jgi:hypothetical protein